MGDFDRHEKPAQGAETKKVILVVVLGAALLAVVGFQMMKPGPATASASTPPLGDGAAIPSSGIDEPATELERALKRDPTADLLRSAEGAPIATAQLRNPFQMGEVWRKSMTKAPNVVVQQVPATIPTTPKPPEVVTVAPLGLKQSDYKLAMIMVQNDRPTALINGAMATVGTRIKDAVVVEVRADSVLLRHKDLPDGPMLELRLKSD